MSVHLTVDLAHGGRWTSLRHGHREWLWKREAPGRAEAVPGSAFVDAGGMEECIPTVRGLPDHGDVWYRPWSGDSRQARVSTPAMSLTRSVSVTGLSVTTAYELQAEPGYQFVWAAHLLLDVSERATLECPGGVPVRLFGPGESWRPSEWPDAGGLDLDRLGPDDGTAVSAIVETSHAVVRDGDRYLRVELEADEQPTAIGLWRNLRGWPPDQPYRSIGVEPMLGRVWDRSTGRPEDLARASDDSGRASWRMTLELGCC